MKRPIQILLLLQVTLSAVVGQAALIIKTDKPKTAGQKTVIRVQLRNTFIEKIQSVRATVLLLDRQGKIVGQAIRWIVGGTKDRPSIEAGGTTAYFFVVSATKPFEKTKVLVNRVVFENGKLADTAVDVKIEEAEK